MTGILVMVRMYQFGLLAKVGILTTTHVTNEIRHCEMRDYATLDLDK